MLIKPWGRFCRYNSCLDPDQPHKLRKTTFKQKWAESTLLEKSLLLLLPSGGPLLATRSGLLLSTGSRPSTSHLWPSNKRTPRRSALHQKRHYAVERHAAVARRLTIKNVILLFFPSAQQALFPCCYRLVLHRVCREARSGLIPRKMCCGVFRLLSRCD